MELNAAFKSENEKFQSQDHAGKDLSFLTAWGKETGFRPAGFGSETPRSPPRRQQAEEAVRWAGGVKCNLGGFAGEAGVRNEGREMGEGGITW